VKWPEDDIYFLKDEVWLEKKGRKTEKHFVDEARNYKLQ
jgi:hypothetical protein